MPSYEYQCQKCGHSFEQTRSVAERDARIHCPRCESLRVERKLSAFVAGRTQSAAPPCGADRASSCSRAGGG